MHAVGFYHHHSRSDRDDYINIIWDNVKKDEKKQFQLLKKGDNKLLTDWDFDSIMLYGSTIFSENGKVTMEPQPKYSNVKLVDVGDKPGLSTNDVIAINMLYNCKRLF